MVKLHTIRPDSRERGSNVAISQAVPPRCDSAAPQNLGLFQRRHHRYRGIAFIWVAIFLIVLILFVGLSLDTAKVYLVAHQLQNAADAAALAGAQVVKNPGGQAQARAQAIAIAFENYADGLPVQLAGNIGNLPDGDVVLGRYLSQTQTFVPATDPNALNDAVKVVARRDVNSLDGPVPLIFGPIANVDTVNITRVAIAKSSGSTGAGLIALEEYPEPQDTGLLVHGNSKVQVNNGAIQVNSWSENHPWSSFRAMGNFILDCAELNVRGTVNPELEDDPYWDTVDYSVNEHTGPLPDPLEALPELRDSGEFPPMTEQWGAKTINSSIIQSEGVWSAEDNAYVLTIGPGYYPGGITMLNPNSKLVLQPGIYALGGTTKELDPNTGELVTKQKETGLCISGGTFVANGVMFYITDSLEGKYGVVSIQGGTHVNVTITEYKNPNSVYYTDGDGGIAIFQDRANTEQAYITGSTEIYLEGTLYFKNANFKVGGDGLQVGTQLIAGTVEIAGNSNVIINYDGRNWTVGFTSFLVE